MAYLLDTVALSELMSKSPAQAVVEWVTSTDAALQYVSVLSIGEIQKGISKLPASHRKVKLEDWFGSLQRTYSDRLLGFELSTAQLWGKLQARLEKDGRPIPIVDSMIAATALHHGLTVVTRNVKDFEASNVDVIDLWK